MKMPPELRAEPVLSVRVQQQPCSHADTALTAREVLSSVRGQDGTGVTSISTELADPALMSTTSHYLQLLANLFPI